MKEARIYVDFNEMIEENLVPLSNTNSIEDSEGNIILLKEGLQVKIFSDDFSSCGNKDNLIADGVVECNSIDVFNCLKWNCRINNVGIYNESQG